MVLKNGILIPRKVVEHKILFDGYEAQFLITFILLYERVFKEKDSIFTEFAIRTLAEMGFKRVQILFSKATSNEERQKFKLLLLLADYGFIAFDNRIWLGEYQKLLSAYKNLLSQKQQNLFTRLGESILSNDSNENAVYVKRARQQISLYQNQLFKKTKILPIFNPENIESTNSGFSHILHGNILLLSNMFSPNNRNPHQHILRIRWTLLLTGMNLLIHISKLYPIIGNDKNLDVVERMFKQISNIVKTRWQELET